MLGRRWGSVQRGGSGLTGALPSLAQQSPCQSHCEGAPQQWPAHGSMSWETNLLQNCCCHHWFWGQVAILHSPVSHTDLNLGAVQQLLPHPLHHQVHKLPLEAPSGKGRWWVLSCQAQPRNHLLPEASDSAVKAAPQGLFSRTRWMMGWAAPLTSHIPPPFSTTLSSRRPAWLQACP